MIMMIKVVGEDQVKILPKSPMGERGLVPQVPSDLRQILSNSSRQKKKTKKDSQNEKKIKFNVQFSDPSLHQSCSCFFSNLLQYQGPDRHRREREEERELTQRPHSHYMSAYTWAPSRLFARDVTRSYQWCSIWYTQTYLKPCKVHNAYFKLLNVVLHDQLLLCHYRASQNAMYFSASCETYFVSVMLQ